MREFWVRLVSMLAIVGVLLGYNSVLDVRAKEDEIARLSAQVAGNGQSDSENGGSTNYKDGTYTGEADGFGGTIQVEVKIEKSKIAEINVISAEKEDGAYLSMAKDMIPKIIDAQSADMEATLYTKLHTVAFLYKPVRNRLSSLPYKNHSPHRK